MIARGVTAHKISPGAHETNNDALKADGRTQKKRHFGQEIATHNGMGWLLCAYQSMYMSRIEPHCRFFDPTSVWRDIAANTICYFSTNFEDTIVPFVSFDPSSNSTSILYLTLLRVLCVRCDSLNGGPVMVKRWTHSTEITGKVWKKYL